jgi:hypothetical protein
VADRQAGSTSRCLDNHSQRPPPSWQSSTLVKKNTEKEKENDRQAIANARHQLGNLPR